MNDLIWWYQFDWTINPLLHLFLDCWKFYSNDCSNGNVIYSFAQFFVLCEFGERLTRQFNEVDREHFNSDWYRFPFGVQKILPIIINGTYYPVLLKGIGGLICTHETFKNVRNLYNEYVFVIRSYH